jgi:hypothetical protein
MKIAARTGKRGLTITRLGRSRSSHSTGTVILRNVKFGDKVFGEMIEEAEREIKPRSRDFMSVSTWPTAKYVARLGGYVDSVTGKRLSTASAVYMVGSKIYYL